MRRHAIEKSGHDGMTIKRRKESTQEVISDREKRGIQKVQGEPQRRGPGASAESGLTADQPGRD